jgi:hypothetical protein
MIFGSFPVTVVLRWLGDIWIDDLSYNCTLQISEVLARDIESEEHALCDESKDEVGLARDSI